ncbi:hypothetical protein ASH00_14405 [Arthrobacter sp. Soil782]|uniref:c-type cytochrome biogenesis protein CcmI n=1 Tax=Arthrobacter sp. Soil782 TaxID=1736410 RepID=UPI0006F63955|nr:c-type cytochrome biogenesis protein CcmI [Arthrobacter sp. Soil782]KRF04293.1 hypothetical protein ASH00_14405 [Arthrobacter sp. Soil782]
MQIQGWHILVLIALVMIAALVVAIVLIVKAVSKRSHTTAAAAPRQPSGKEQRLAELDDLRARGQVTDAEYEAARADILRS